MHALLQGATANTCQHCQATPAITTAVVPTASPDPATSLPIEVLHSAQRGELQTVVKWLGEGGSIDAVCFAPTNSGQTSAVTLLHATASIGQLKMTEELLKLGASVDMPSSHGLSPLSWLLHNTAIFRP